LRRAPLWLRLHAADPKPIFAEFEQLGWTWRRAEVLPSAIQLLGDVDVTKTDAFRRGHVEVQDLGSQLLLATAGLAPGGHWLDACAGAGGKTLQLAALLGPGGKIDAHDIRPAALDELATRAARAGVGSQIRILRAAPEGIYDGVLVDAPCSGSGTWRRAPHLKWTTTEPAVARAAEQQRTLLDTFAVRVRPGGRLLYATCSLSRRENADVVAAFLAHQPEFDADGAGRSILPAAHDTDGFFVASLRRR
jgi:16S rRNA (cytosine967-C5)-methyltransferase